MGVLGGMVAGILRNGASLKEPATVSSARSARNCQCRAASRFSSEIRRSSRRSRSKTVIAADSWAALGPTDRTASWSEKPAETVLRAAWSARDVAGNNTTHDLPFLIPSSVPATRRFRIDPCSLIPKCRAASGTVARTVPRGAALLCGPRSVSSITQHHRWRGRGAQGATEYPRVVEIDRGMMQTSHGAQGREGE